MTTRRGPDWTGRLSRLAPAIAAADLDAVVVSSPINIRYLTGFRGTAGLFVVAGGRGSLLVDGRYERAVRDEVASGSMAPIEVESVPGRYVHALASFLDRAGHRRVGFEAGHVTVAELEGWREAAAGVTWSRTDALVESLRLIKDEGEQRVLRDGARRLSLVAGNLSGLVRVGRREIDVARSIDRALEDAGFSAPAFPTIVASGPNSAQPHARPTTRVLAPGDLVLLDFGGVLDGYCTDLTRMAALGTVGEDAKDLVRAVIDAQAAAIDLIRPGVPVFEIDQAARQVLTDRGLGSAFLHATGHGLGLEVHEAPRLGRPVAGDRPEVLVEGMVCTVEPGAYVAGLGGARIEDDVLVTAAGREVLTAAPRDLLVV